jgi:hypothetical protein
MLVQCKVENGSKSLCRLTAKTYAKAAKHWGKKRSVEVEAPTTTDVDVIPTATIPTDSSLESDLQRIAPDILVPAYTPYGPHNSKNPFDALGPAPDNMLPPSARKHLAPPANHRPWLIPHTPESEHWLLNIITTQPSLLKDVTAEEARSLESLVDAEMEEEERNEWFAAEWEVMGTEQSEAVNVPGKKDVSVERDVGLEKDVSLERALARRRNRLICFSPFSWLCPG